MFNFIKESLRELEHVVWPTPKETRKYMNYNIGVIIALTLFLSVLGFIFSMSLSTARGIIHPSTPIINPANQPATKADIDNLLKNLSGSVQATTVSGEGIKISTSTGTTEKNLTGTTIHTTTGATQTGAAQ
ncbi:preprotein translocase subunit SecE [Candidatus Gracilibacteria bacterium]|nr:preprotein translocase subunit SecE [Candidatus Gracilibacteria bacterium]